MHFFSRNMRRSGLLVLAASVGSIMVASHASAWDGRGGYYYNVMIPQQRHVTRTIQYPQGYTLYSNSDQIAITQNPTGAMAPVVYMMPAPPPPPPMPRVRG